MDGLLLGQARHDRLKAMRAAAAGEEPLLEADGREEEALSSRCAKPAGNSDGGRDGGGVVAGEANESGQAGADSSSGKL